MGSSNVKTEREDHEFCLIETCPNFNGVFRGYAASTEEQSYSYPTFCCLPKNTHVWQRAKQVQNTTELQWRQNRRASKPQGFMKSGLLHEEYPDFYFDWLGYAPPPRPPTSAIIPIVAVLWSFKAFFSHWRGICIPPTLTGWMSESDDYFCHKDQQANNQQKANIFLRMM